MSQLNIGMTSATDKTITNLGFMAMAKYAPALWILGGLLLMLPSILGNERPELVPIGIIFMVVGIATKNKNTEPSNTEGS